MDEKIKNYVGIAIVGSLIVFALSTIGYVKTYSRNTEPTSFRSFSVSSDGKIIAVPDVAQFTFSLISEGGTDITATQKKNTERVNAAIDFLKERGVAEEDITTQQYSIEPRYAYYGCESGPCPPPTISGYTVHQSALVKVRDFGLIGDLLSGVVEKGANSVSQLSFTIDDRSNLENEARTKAITKAKEKAEHIADAGNFTLGRLLSIQESGSVPTPYPLYGGFGGGGDIALEKSIAPTIEPGSQDVIVNVTLTYEID